MASMGDKENGEGKAGNIQLSPDINNSAIYDAKVSYVCDQCSM